MEVNSLADNDGSKKRSLSFVTSPTEIASNAEDDDGAADSTIDRKYIADSYMQSENEFNTPSEGDSWAAPVVTNEHGSPVRITDGESSCGGEDNRLRRNSLDCCATFAKWEDIHQRKSKVTKEPDFSGAAAGSQQSGSPPALLSPSTTVGDWIATYASGRAVHRAGCPNNRAGEGENGGKLRYKGTDHSSCRSLPVTIGQNEHPKYSKMIRINKSEPQVHIRCPIQNLYVFKEKIGVGSWGVVHLAVERSSGFLRAIKKIPKKPNMDMKRFRQEMTILRGFDHPRVIRLYETFEDYSTLYMVMEYCRGGELFQRISEEGVLPEPAVAWIMREILSAIAYCHSKGVCHRDIKPENFLFSDTDIRSSLKLVDFGLAKKFSPAAGDPLSSKVGTLYYLAPELLNNDHYTHKVDLWSAGVMMYSMLFGQPPFTKDGCSDVEVLRAISQAEIDYHPQQQQFGTRRPPISPEAEKLIRSLCNKDPDLRLEAADALSHNWFLLQFPSPLRQLPTLNSFTQQKIQAQKIKLKVKKIDSPIISGEQDKMWNDNDDTSRVITSGSLSYGSPASGGPTCGHMDDTNLSSNVFCCDFIELGCNRHSKKCQRYNNNGDLRPYRTVQSTALDASKTSPGHIKSPQMAAIHLLNKLGLRSSGDAALLAQKLIRKLENFARLNPLKKGLLALAAQQLEPHARELAYIRCIFDLLDTGRDGVLTFEELFNSISALQRGDIKRSQPDSPASAAASSLAEESLRALLCYVDLDGDGVIEYSDFVAACLDQSTFKHPAAHKAVFRVLDRDMDNKIGLNELKAALGWNKLESPVSSAAAASCEEDSCDTADANRTTTTADSMDGGETDQQFILKLLTEADVDRDGFIGREDFTAIFANDEEEDSAADAARLYRASVSSTRSPQFHNQDDISISGTSPQISPLPMSWRGGGGLGSSALTTSAVADQFDFSAETRNIFSEEISDDDDDGGGGGGSPSRHHHISQELSSPASRRIVSN